jgi:hypothetical protein
MTRNAYQGRTSRSRPNLSRFGWRNIVGPQMHPVSATCYGDVTSGVDEQTACWLPKVLADNTKRRAGEGFKVARGKIFLPQLNEVNSAAPCFSDLRQQGALAGTLVTVELGTIGNVAEKQAVMDLSLRFRGHVRPVRPCVWVQA